MLSPETTAFLEGGCGLLVGSVSPDGEPHAARGWGVVVLSAGGDLRVLIDADDATALENLTSTTAVALTAGDVRTFESIQLKGNVVAVEPATEDDEIRAVQFCDAFFGAVQETDATPRAKLDRLVPDGYVACVVRVRELFDQTPGPGAGARVEGASP